MVASARSSAGLDPRRYRRLAHKRGDMGDGNPRLSPVEYVEPVLALSPIRNLTVGLNQLKSNWALLEPTRTRVLVLIPV